MPPDGYLRAARGAICNERERPVDPRRSASPARAAPGERVRPSTRGHPPRPADRRQGPRRRIVLVSAVVGSDEVLGLFRPGQHGSTFEATPRMRGGDRGARPAGRRIAERSAARARLAIPTVPEGGIPFRGHRIRQRGLWIGVDLHDGTPKPGEVSVASGHWQRGFWPRRRRSGTIRPSPPTTRASDETRSCSSGRTSVLVEL